MRLTVNEVREQYGGMLPPGATLRPDDDAGTTPLRPVPRAKRSTPSKRKPNAVVSKLLSYRRFFEVAATLDPRLHPLAVALWVWLWTCEKDGRVRTSERRLAVRFGVHRDTVRKRLNELTEAGFVNVIRRGKWKRSASILRVHCNPTRPNP